MHISLFSALFYVGIWRGPTKRCEFGPFLAICASKRSPNSTSRHPRRPLQDPQRAFGRPHAHFPAALRSKFTTIGSSPSTPPIPPRPKTPQIEQISPSGDVQHTPNSAPTDVNRALCPPSVTNPKSHARILVGGAYKRGYRGHTAPTAPCAYIEKILSRE